jgi:hypothetical protein
MNNRDNLVDDPQEFPDSRHRFVAVVGDDEAHALSVLSAEGALLLARCEIAEAYYHGGDSLALATLAASSLRLYGCAVAGDLGLPVSEIFDGLQECAANLGIAERAQDEVQRAISFGPRRYGTAA